MENTLKVIDFMGLRKITVGLSIVLLLISLGSLVVNGLKFGLDFTGGTQVELSFEEPADLDRVRELILQSGVENFEAQLFGEETEVLVRIQDPGAAGSSDESKRLGEQLSTLLDENIGGVELARSPDFIGAVVGEELRDQGGLGMLVALGMVMIYIALRFQFKFAVGAVAALAHDVLITLGFFSVFQLEFNLTVLAALLAVIGYSLNDTIVVSDRIRENFRILRKTDVFDIINTSITQTFSRTIITSITTFLVLLALLIFGGSSIEGFAIALMVGVFIGTYSSIYVAANVLISMHITKEDLMPPVKENEELDEMP